MTIFAMCDTVIGYMQNNFPKTKDYYSWQGYQLANDTIELGFAPTIGGRIISLKVFGEELLFVNQKYLGETFDFSSNQDLEKEKLRLGHRLWGGDKTWVAPEKSWIAFLPPLDLDATPYAVELQPNAIVMTSPIDRETGLRIIRRVELTAQSEIILQQTFINGSNHDVTCAIWDVTQLLRPFKIYIPIDSQKINPDLRFDAGVSKRNQFISEENSWSKITCDQPIQFKYGCKVREGLVMAVTKRKIGNIVMTRRFDIYPDKVYPEEDMVEVYNSSEYDYLELEILSPLVNLAPGEKTSHQQTWHFDVKGTVATGE